LVHAHDGVTVSTNVVTSEKRNRIVVILHKFPFVDFYIEGKGRYYFFNMK